MRHGASFADVLDETLRGYQPETAARPPFGQAPAGPHRVQPVPLPPNPFLFQAFDGRIAAFETRPIDGAYPMHGGLSSAAAASDTRPRQERPRPAAVPPIEAPVAARPVVVVPAPPRRKLTVAQQRSLDAFVDAGASIGADFSALELRSAFRRLARRYHPDRHPLASETEKAALARRFVAITADYDVLLTALEPASC